MDISHIKTAELKAMLQQDGTDISALLQAMKQDQRVSVAALAERFWKHKCKEEQERERVLQMYSLETA
ncbi:MAG: ribonuclease HII, partial [Megasphaera sp.]|nr:ribonuclease HII [Megasphaera sp.]